MSQNVMCSKDPPCLPCIIFIKQNISTHSSPGEDLAGEEVTEALPESHPTSSSDSLA